MYDARDGSNILSKNVRPTSAKFKQAARFKDSKSKSGHTSSRRLNMTNTDTDDDVVPGPGAYTADPTRVRPQQSVYGFARSPKPTLHE